eukprot:UN15494
MMNVYKFSCERRPTIHSHNLPHSKHSLRKSPKCSLSAFLKNSTPITLHIPIIISNKRMLEIHPPKNL